jgi:hypothetical protein
MKNRLGTLFVKYGAVLVILALFCFLQDAIRVSTHAQNPQATPAPPGTLAASPHPAISEQPGVNDLSQAFKDIGDDILNLRVKLAAANRQIKEWKDRATAAESALEEARKLIPETPKVAIGTTGKIKP